MIILSSLFVSLCVGYFIYSIAPPLPRLTKRLAPYDTVVRVRLGGLAVTGSRRSTANKPFFIIEFFRPAYEQLSRIIEKIASTEDSDALSLRLEQAGYAMSVDAYRAAVVKKVFLGIGAGVVLGAGMGNFAALLFFPAVFGIVAFSKSHSSIDKKIEQRRSAIRSEMYTVNQLLALYVRTGSGVSQALSSVAGRTRGIVSQEITEVLHRVRSGIPIDESLFIASRKTPEPHAMRTYKLLAAASHRGVDLTEGLLDLAKDLRRTLREDVKATGTKRRAAMLIPTIGILAPIMLLFVAAPIPSIVLTGR